ncbi:MAG: IS1595 family transposase [Hyphomicrobiales bacterium]
MARYTFKQFQAEYPDDAACLAQLMKSKFGGTELTCPGCGAVESKFHPMHSRKAYACQECGYHVYPCAGTIFHKSSTPLTKWFFAMYLMTSTRHGVAAKELERQLGVTYKTAWRMAHELRKLMASADKPGPLSGSVEIDETVMGGHQKRHARRSKGTNKTVIMGLVERGGNLIAGPIPDSFMGTMDPIVRENIVPGTRVMTDEFKSYRRLGDGYIHQTVNHSKKEYVRGDVHTNTIEGHWSHFKRAILGTHVHISSQHMWKYVSEFSYRRNYRQSHTLMFDRLVAAFSQPRLQDA